MVSQNYHPSFLRRQTECAPSRNPSPFHSSPPDLSPREDWLRHLMSGVTELPPVIPAEAGIHPPAFFTSRILPKKGRKLDLSLHTSYCSTYPDHHTDTVMTEWPLQDAKNKTTAPVNAARTNAPTLADLLLQIPRTTRNSSGGPLAGYPTDRRPLSKCCYRRRNREGHHATTATRPVFRPPPGALAGQGYGMVWRPGSFNRCRHGTPLGSLVRGSWPFGRRLAYRGHCTRAWPDRPHPQRPPLRSDWSPGNQSLRVSNTPSSPAIPRPREESRA